jgi:hypothetical protein
MAAEGADAYPPEELAPQQAAAESGAQIVRHLAAQWEAIKRHPVVVARGAGTDVQRDHLAMVLNQCMPKPGPHALVAQAFQELYSRTHTEGAFRRAVERDRATHFIALCCGPTALNRALRFEHGSISLTPVGYTVGPRVPHGKARKEHRDAGAKAEPAARRDEKATESHNWAHRAASPTDGAKRLRGSRGKHRAGNNRRTFDKPALNADGVPILSEARRRQLVRQLDDIADDVDQDGADQDGVDQDVADLLDELSGGDGGDSGDGGDEDGYSGDEDGPSSAAAPEVLPPYKAALVSPPKAAASSPDSAKLAQSLNGNLDFLDADPVAVMSAGSGPSEKWSDMAD